MAREPADDLIYSPATRGNIGVLIMIAGPSGSGKTLSALRVATGLANGGPIFFCDTEHGRARIYADDFSFNHLELKEPFSPDRFEQAAVIAQRAGAAVLITDSFSHEHVGPGGVLDMFEAEIEKMTKGDVTKREALKYAAWIKPKVMHKHLVQRLWQLNCHIILCCHGEKKLDLIKNDRGKMVPNPDAGLSAVCSPDLPFAMTASFMLELKRPGVPLWMKHLNKWDALIPLDRPLDEATGARIGAWARGEKPPASNLEGKPEGKRESKPEGKPEGKPADDTPAKGRTEQVVEELITAYQATKTRADHLAIADTKEQRDRVTWLQKNRPEMYARVHAVMEASWARTEPQREATA
jgi:AAA domain-containing protein